jgi:hypothetical protein
MKLIIIPENSFTENSKKQLNKIIEFSKNILNKENISLPKEILFHNSFEDFIDKILPEVKTYGYNENTCREIIKIALNHGTYGTINYEKNQVIEMNFNPFKNGEYSALEFLELIIHESLHLHLSKKINKDINLLKFNFNGLNLESDKKILQIDEGYANFMTNKLLREVDVSKIKGIKIPTTNTKKPKYDQKNSKVNLESFDKNYEKIFMENKKIGEKLFEDKFSFKDNNELILDFAVNELRKIL